MPPARDGDARALPLLIRSYRLGLERGDPRPHGRQRLTSLFGDPRRWWRPAETREARSSLLQAASPAESRVCRFRLRLPVRFLGELWLLSPGGWRASCPATYRPTHGHRHVRIWAPLK